MADHAVKANARSSRVRVARLHRPVHRPADTREPS
jgi:hypothetical protein